MAKRLRSFLLAGLIAVLPIGLTLFVLYWLVTTAERMLGGIARQLLPDGWYLPGSGLLVTLLLLLLIGALVQTFIVARLLRVGERVLEHLPLARAIYGPLRELARLLIPGSKDGALGQPVAVRIGPDMEIVGFVTTSTPPTALVRAANTTAVYLPMSYQLGGYTLFLPPDRFRRLDLPADEALRIALTGGMGSALSTGGTSASNQSEGSK